MVIIQDLNILLSGRNQGYRSTFQTYAEWEKNYPFVSDSDSEECSDSDSDDKKGESMLAWKHRNKSVLSCKS